MRDVRCDSFVGHDVETSQKSVRAGVAPLLALPLLVLVEVPRRQLLPAGRAAGRAPRALSPLVPLHPVAPVAVTAAVVAAFDPAETPHQVVKREKRQAKKDVVVCVRQMRLAANSERATGSGCLRRSDTRPGCRSRNDESCVCCLRAKLCREAEESMRGTKKDEDD